MSIYGGNMKKQKIFLKNKQLLGFYLVVGVLFSVISVVAPSISGELVFTCFNIYTFTTVFHCGSVFFSVFPD